MMIKTLLCLQIFIELYGHFAWKSKTNETEGWKFHTGSCKGLTIWFLRGGGTDYIGYFRKKISCTLISREKILVRKYLAKKILHWKKYLSWHIMLEKILHYCMSGKKMFHQRFEEKYSYTKPNQERKYCISGHHHHLLAFVLQQILKDTAGC